MEKYKKFLTEQLKFKDYVFLTDDEKKIKNQGKAEWLTGKITAKKFRKASVKENTREDILKKIDSDIISLGNFKNIEVYEGEIRFN